MTELMISIALWCSGPSQNTRDIEECRARLNACAISDKGKVSATVHECFQKEKLQTVRK